MSDSPLSDALMAYRKEVEYLRTLELDKVRLIAQLDAQERVCNEHWDKLMDLCIGYERTSE